MSCFEGEIDTRLELNTNMTELLIIATRITN